jgi:hypothetical protein
MKNSTIDVRTRASSISRCFGRSRGNDNLVFARVAGAGWDAFTIGFYRDLHHFAEDSDLSDDALEEAARAAGFEARNRIGTYLRTLIDSHHDTLATLVR